jgi:hypothetical protein
VEVLGEKLIEYYHEMKMAPVVNDNEMAEYHH